MEEEQTGLHLDAIPEKLSLGWGEVSCEPDLFGDLRKLGAVAQIKKAAQRDAKRKEKKDATGFCEKNIECVETKGGSKWYFGPRTTDCYTYEYKLSLIHI